MDAELIDWAIKQTTAPTVDPVTVSEARLHLKVEDEEDDALIKSLISTATQYCEHRTKRQFITATWKLYLSGFPDVIVLPRPPLGAVSSVAYTDVDGASQTVSASDYQVTTANTPAGIVPAYGKSWPATRAIRDSVIVTYTAGYGAAGSAVPAPIRQAILLYVGQLYEFRENVIAGTIIAQVPKAVDSLLSPYIVGHIW